MVTACAYWWIHAAVNYFNPDQRISVAQALHACTLAGARLAFEEHCKGSLAVGKLGDCALLEADPHSVAQEEIEDIPVLATVIGGRVVGDGRL